ncbi:protein Red-like [Daphnia pulicaria]|uniref:protein Red-like n=1 Tax=Daphnia pulicaria TaxID=35523 RepID=UPI001EEC7C6C|nr:protein Red-like [Daphnia pulicaria]
MPDRDGQDAGPGEASSRLTNDDFRKLMMTPRAGFGSGSGSSSNLGMGSVRGESSVRKTTHGKSDQKRAKKSEYLKEKKEEEEILAELAKKYRDRAKERRDGGEASGPDALATLGAYRAVAPDIKSTMDAAERRKQMIQESKFLGGDMEHTHLVKGLDYALLQKVRSEIEQFEEEDDEQLEQAVEGEKKEGEKEVEKKKEGDDEIQFKTIIGKNIFRAVFRSKPPERNEHFLPGRMAYLIELEDENAESDIPTTVLRSKADCPGLESLATLSTNDIVINKLTQILSYLRQGKIGKKLKKPKENKEMPPPQIIPGLKVNKSTIVEDTIYSNIGTYVAPTKEKTASSSSRDRERRSDKRDYFDDKSRKDKDGDADRDKSKDALKSAAVLEAERTLGALLKPGAADKRDGGSSKKADKMLSKLSAEPEGYAECYPGFEEMNDALEDSDDEADYSKMDLGNKKGPVGRWDFDTAEEYGDYMNKKEALPKAAYQYGIKMADGRKTRNKTVVKTDKTEKAELDREWQKIQSILHKRKGGPSGETQKPEKSVRRN